MATQVRDLTVEQLEALISWTVRRTMEDYLEDLEALASDSYRESIEEARGQARLGEVVKLELSRRPGVVSGDSA